MAAKTKWIAFLVDPKNNAVSRARLVPDMPRVLQEKHEAGFVEVDVEDEKGTNPKYKGPLVAPRAGAKGGSSA